jgi:hypothetical protein
MSKVRSTVAGKLSPKVAYPAHYIKDVMLSGKSFREEDRTESGEPSNGT